jgi:hypothetical protein
MYSNVMFFNSFSNIFFDYIFLFLSFSQAIVNLMADKSTFKLMAKEGVIWGLSSLALLDHFELSQMCAQALCRWCDVV